MTEQETSAGTADGVASLGKLLQLHPHDNVAVARAAIATGEQIDTALAAVNDVPVGHKIALRAIAADAPVFKYGQRIGVASREIAPGEHVHTHNVSVADTVHREAAGPTNAKGAEEERKGRKGPIGLTFRGFQRADGRVGTRNYLGVLTTVNCSATVAKRIAAHFTPEQLAAWPNVDGVVALTHSTGCAISSGEALDVLRRTTAGYAHHPNFAGVLVLGLGCEVNQVSALVPLEGAASQVSGPQPAAPTFIGRHVRGMTIQEEGGTVAAIREGIAAIEAMLPEANAAQRTEQPLSKLVVALQCGGSDAWSGITANPALGLAVDKLITAGGTAILSETPEIFGAEHLLTSRAEPGAAAQLMERIDWWQRYASLHGNTLDNNPSPGNKAGGLTTILEKSLGAVAKAGSSPLRAVIEYAQPLPPDVRGLVFMDSPGYDPVSATGQIASGANLLCFTTGRGSVFGAKPVPSLKLATNSGLFRRMSDDMDLNCGTVLDGTETLEQIGERIFAAMLATASGVRSRSEEHGFGEEEFQPWVQSAVL